MNRKNFTDYLDEDRLKQAMDVDGDAMFNVSGESEMSEYQNELADPELMYEI